MTLEQFYTYQEQTFDSYVATIIKNESKDAKKEIARRAKREIALSQLMKEELAQIAVEDHYNLESMTLIVDGDSVTIKDVLLGQAIASLPPQRREVILMSYFLNMNDPQIADLLGIGEDAVFFRRNSTLQRLKKILRGMNYER